MIRFDVEEWRPINGGHYAVSNLGRVKRVTRARRAQPERQVKLSAGRGGYPSAHMCVNRKYTHQFVHRLVAIAFLGPVPEGKEVNHKNGDKADARLANLEYVTPSDNCKHAYVTGLNRPPTKKPAPLKGEKNGMAKLTEDQVGEMRRLHAMGAGVNALMRQFGVGHSSVGYIVSRTSWRHVV